MKLHKLISKVDGFRPIIQRWVLAQRMKFPRLVSLELTNACNAKCTMCPRDKMTRPVKLMDFSLIKDIALELREHNVHRVNLFWFGESLLHPKCFEVMRFLRKSLPKTKLNLSTNGQLLDGDIAMGVLSSGIDNLNIDIDGYEKDTYESVRKKLSFERVTRNIVEFMKLREVMKLQRPRVSVTMIEMESTEKEIVPFRRRWRRVVDDVLVTKFNTWCQNVKDRNISSVKEKVDGIGFTFPCENPFKELVISADGRALACCLDFNCSMPVGDAKVQTIKEIWKGHELNKLRKALTAGRQNEIPLCRGCNDFIFQEEGFWANLWRRDGIPTGRHGRGAG